MSTNDSGVDNAMFSREGSTEAERERKQSGVRISSNRNRSRKRAGAARAGERRRNSTEQCRELERVRAERKEMKQYRAMP